MSFKKILNLDKPKGILNLSKPKGILNLDKPEENVNLDKPKENVNLDKPKENVNLSKPKGILNLSKPKGISSAQAVAKVKRILGVGQVGHMGTLDPSAEGVLLVGVGKATRLFDFLLSKDKAYTACFKFGFETDTLDGEGKIVKTCDYIPTKQEILAAFAHLLGEQMQIPPAFSAKSVNGVRSYSLARQGMAVELSPSRVVIHDLRLIDFKGDEAWLSIHCSSGTYIRSICRDLAQLTNSCATMTSLTRTRCGKYDLSDSVDFESLERLKGDAVIGLDVVLSDLQRLDVPVFMQKSLDNGIKLCLDGLVDGKKYAVYCNDILYGIATALGDFIKITTYLKD